jgi:predicted nuclease of restriction endonuclease-like (RecB) superfamily
MKRNHPKSSGLKALAQDNEGFSEIVRLIAGSRQQAIQAVNSTLIDLYWQVGETISRKIASSEWGDGVVPQLAQYIARTQPGLRGFTRANLFRMRQFYETYRDDTIVVALLRQLPWTHHMIILGQSKRPEEREFYLRMAGTGTVVESPTGAPVEGRPLRTCCAHPGKSLGSDATNAARGALYI